MKFIHELNRIYVPNERNQIIAEVTFPNIDYDTVNINHTFVDDSLRGQKVASQLIQEVVDQIKIEKKKIIPTCSYAIGWFQKHPEYSDLLKNDL